MHLIKKYKDFIILGLLVGLILGLGAQSSLNSNALSGRLTRLVVEIFGRFDSVGYQAREIEKYLRKFAHFSEYLLLATITFSAFYFHSRRLIVSAFGCLVFVGMIAITDEMIIQRLVSVGRTYSVYDVMFDMFGASLGVFSLLIFNWLNREDQDQS